MKKTQIFPISFLLLSLFLSSTAKAAEQLDPILDITGKQLRSGISYHILPLVRGRGGGLTLGHSISNESCPLDVVQDQLEVKPGLPVQFTPVNPKKGVIRVSTDLNLKFLASSICVQSTVWKLVNKEGQYVISTSGVEGNPGVHTISNWFKIEKEGKDYKMVFCPTVCNFCKVICRDVGIFIKDGVRRLALSDVPFKIMFRKA